MSVYEIFQFLPTNFQMREREKERERVFIRTTPLFMLGKKILWEDFNDNPPVELESSFSHDLNGLYSIRRWSSCVLFS